MKTPGDQHDDREPHESEGKQPENREDRSSTASDVERLFAGVRAVRVDPVTGAPLTGAPVDGPAGGPAIGGGDRDTPPPLPYQGVNDHGVVIESRPCRGCGYDLRGLTMADACPECHWPVARSVSAPLLVNSPPEHLRVLLIGVTVVIVAQLAGFVGSVVGFVGGAALSGGNVAFAELFGTAVGMLFSVTNLVGWWYFSTPDPALAPDEQRTNSRRVLRACAAATIAGYGASLVLKLLYHNGAIPAGNTLTIPLGTTPMPIGTSASLALGALTLVTAVLNVVVTSVAMAYLSSVSARVPDAQLQADTRRMVWLVWVLLFVPCFGGLISIVLVLIYLFRMRSAISGILAQQRLLDARATG